MAYICGIILVYYVGTFLLTPYGASSKSTPVSDKLAAELDQEKKEWDEMQRKINETL